MYPIPDRQRSTKSTAPASRAPGVWAVGSLRGVASVGRMRAMAASTVARWCSSKKVAGSAGVMVSSLCGDGTVYDERGSRHEQRTQRATRDLETGLDPRLGATPDGVLVLDGEDAVEPALVERVDHAAPVDLAETGHPVAPPADVPRVPAIHGDPRPAVPGPLLGEQFDVLGLGVGDLVHVWLERLHRVDPHPQQVGGVEVEVETEREHPLPQLRA